MKQIETTSDSNTVCKRAEALLTEGKRAEAEQILKSGVKTYPGADEIYYMLGNLYRSECNWSSALENYYTALELNPNSPASVAIEMTNEILDFYCKDCYNP